MFNPYYNMFGGQPVQGTSNYGPDLAQAGATGAQQLKVNDPYSQPGAVGQYLGAWESPEGGVQGYVAVPKTVAPEQILEISIDTTNEVDTTQQVLFDAKDLYKNTANCRCTGAQGGCIYSQSKDCNLYDSLVSMLCSKTYVIKGMRFEVTATTAASGAVGTPTLNIPIEVYRRNLDATTTTSRIRPQNFRSPYQQIQFMVDIPITDNKQVLDESTAWILEVPPNLRVDIQLQVALRSA